MAGGSRFLSAFLLFCVFDAFDNRLVPYNVGDCTEMREKLDSVTTQLQETTRRNSQLDGEALVLRREVGKLKLQLSTCSSVLPYISTSHFTQLQKEMINLLEAIDSEMSKVLKITALTWHVKALQRSVESASNSTETEIRALKAQLSAKTADLDAENEKINKTDKNWELILAIISQQVEIVDLWQTEFLSQTSASVDERIMALQELLDRKLGELQRREHPLYDVLKLISVRTEIKIMERRINILNDKSKIEVSDAKRQLRQKVEQLQGAIMQLTDRENDKNLTREILRLQIEVERLSNLISNLDTKGPKITELTEQIEEKKREEIFLINLMRNADNAVSQLIMRSIVIMEELRHLQPTTGSQDVLTLIQTYKQDYGNAQTEIQNLKKQLNWTREQCSGLQEQYKRLTGDLENRIEQLNKTGDSPAALILSLTSIHDEIKTLKKKILTSTDPNDNARLQKLLQEKKEELNTKTADIERLIPNSQIILMIINLLNDVWDLQSKYTNGTTEEITAMQERLEGLLSELDSTEEGNMKQLMTILIMQSQVEYLQKLLPKAEDSKTQKVTQLSNELEAKQAELDQVFMEMAKSNQNTTDLLKNIFSLQSRLRQLETDKEIEDKAIISNLREQLKMKEKENVEYQALIRTLQVALNQTDVQCSQDEQKIKDLQKRLDAAIEELGTKSNRVTSLTLQVSTLTLQLEELKKQLENSVSQSVAKDLQRSIAQQSAKLENKTEELRKQSTEAQRLLQIIDTQVKIEQQTLTASNESDYAKVRALQDHLNHLIDGIQDTDNENTKLTLQILVQQEEIARLIKEQESQLGAKAKKIKDLEDNLELVRNQMQAKTDLLKKSTTRISNLSAQIMELHEKIGPLQEELADLKQTYAENLADLEERLNITKNKLQNTELQLKNANTENYNLIKKIADLKAEQKKAKEEASQTLKKSTDAQERRKRQEKENNRLESTNRDLKQQVEELENCCKASPNCEDQNRQLQQCQEDADLLHQFLQEKDAALKQLQDEIEELRQEKDKLQDDYDNLVKKLNKVDDRTIHGERVTWDPNTAHPRIVLSANNTEVYTTNRVRVRNNPNRFDVTLGVLGATGYSSGRHYWEVYVAEKNCYHIGMASDAARRKGSLTFRPSYGYWTIVLNKQQELKAIDRRSHTLKVDRLPVTLGILLDYEKGQVSFYDATARSHLYSFTGHDFTGNIYPFLNYCVEDIDNSNPIVSLNPGSTDWIN
ncbi:putative leucine-rich repeat-containing protein DDB_G0290503 [Cyprinodon tularosa]|uniref:putative leucine-rich repeat-containing protein DDB_G0290503 n=1 Tax=Cyprinodon tularosa TaxID=77115 RepID=UPI0018E1E5A5|nr:putative leucine-rich repeat-containing protein DDB_G0290503 [Cyprinodon tularosa]